MFENSCAIRSDFMLVLKKLCLAKKEKNIKNWKLLERITLPKKEGIFQYLPLYNLYKNEFCLFQDNVILKTDSFLQPYILPECKDSYLVIVNGSLNKELSKIPLIEGLKIEEKIKLTSKVKEENFFTFLNQTLASKELLITLSSKRHLDNKPLQIIQVITKEMKKGTLLCPCISLKLEEEAFATFYFSGVNLSFGSSWLNQTIQIELEKKAKANVYSYYPNFSNLWHFNSVRGFLKQDSFLDIFSLREGSLLEHNDLNIALVEPLAGCEVKELCLLDENKHSHSHIRIHHQAKETYSNQVVKSVVKDGACFSFEATALIDKEAQRSQSYQLNKNLVLGEKAQAFSKPFLQVFADDVKAKHGATIHKIEEEDLFYLTSRGLKKRKANQLLIKGFAQEIINKVNIESLQKILKNKVF